MSATILEQILESTRSEVEARKREGLKKALPARAREEARLRQADAGRFTRALSAGGIKVIAEIKRRSPSKGDLRVDADVGAIAAAYAKAGASAISVLTEGPHFGGSLADLAVARASCETPILRKDFIVDPFQLEEAAAVGADAVLLIVAALSPRELESLRTFAGGLGLEALVEVHDERELDIALSAGASLVGVNNRDLRDFSVDMERTFALMSKIPAGVSVVSESGISGRGDLRRLSDAGVAAVLIGETLMRSPDEQATLESLLVEAGA